jgi:small conductance mechanosensitive channel
MSPEALDLNSMLAGWLEAAIALLPRLVLALSILLVFLLMASLVAGFLRRRLLERGIDEALARVLSRIVRWSLLVLGTVVALDQVDFDVTTFVTGLGVVGFTLGFAFQDISKNFVAGLLLLIQQPFRIGDLIEVDGHLGTVTDIDLRTTVLRSNDGLTIFIPNGEVYTSALTNYSHLPTRRVEIEVGVAYDTDLDRVRRVAIEAMRALPTVHSEPAPEALFHSFGGSSIDLTLRCWTNSPQREFLATRDAAVEAIQRAFVSAGIEIPYPTQVQIRPAGPSMG